MARSSQYGCAKAVSTVGFYYPLNAFPVDLLNFEKHDDDAAAEAIGAAATLGDKKIKKKNRKPDLFMGHCCRKIAKHIWPRRR